MACGKRTAISQNGPVGFESSTLTKTPKDRFAEHASNPTQAAREQLPRANTWLCRPGADSHLPLDSFHLCACSRQPIGDLANVVRYHRRRASKSSCALTTSACTIDPATVWHLRAEGECKCNAPCCLEQKYCSNML